VFAGHITDPNYDFARKKLVSEGYTDLDKFLRTVHLDMTGGLEDMAKAKGATNRSLVRLHHEDFFILNSRISGEDDIDSEVDEEDVSAAAQEGDNDNDHNTSRNTEVNAYSMLSTSRHKTLPGVAEEVLINDSAAD
jgi:hypothetical protein